MKTYDAVVLFSGGQDSTTCLYHAVKQHGHAKVLALTIYYKQRHEFEVRASKDIAELVEVDRVVHNLTALSEIADSALVDSTRPIEEGGVPDREMQGGLPTSFVPGRNLMFLGLASAIAVKHGARIIYTGTCQTDYSGYPDCRREFIDAMERAATLAMPSSRGPIKIRTPLMYLTKAETVQMALDLGKECWLAIGTSVTCYEGERPGCGECPACKLRAKGFEEVGLADPAQPITSNSPVIGYEEATDETDMH